MTTPHAKDKQENPSDGIVELVGPFRTHDVSVNGYRVPYLTANPAAGGKIYLSLDDRYGIEVEVAEFDRWARFVANCIAIAGGYTCHPGTEGAPLPIPRTGYGRMFDLATRPDS